MIGYRSNARVFRALLKTSTYRAAWNMLWFYERPWDALSRYVFGSGAYPTTIRGRTPLGSISIKIYHPHDMQTINEVFCRRDYPVRPEDKRIVDIGANIGISAMYFLTYAPNSFCYLFEPLPMNAARLKENLKPFAGRFQLFEKAVFNRSGVVQFHGEPTGRYSQIATEEHQKDTEQLIPVECCHVSDILRQVIAGGSIDLVKIDIEGMEAIVIEAIDRDLFPSIQTIVYETNKAGNVAVLEYGASPARG